MSTQKQTNPKISYSLLLLVIVFEAIFLSLAYWQYNRMNEREGTFDIFEEKLATEAVLFDKITAPKDWEVVEVSGFFDYKNEKLLQNRRYKTYSGYRIITPFTTDDGHRLIVDRGWIPKTYNRAPPEELEDKKGRVTFTGVVRHIPPKKAFIDGPLYGTTTRVIKRIDSEIFPTLSEYKHILIQANSSGNKNIRSFIEKPKTGARHSEYMLTWLCLALILPTLYLSLLYSRRKDENS